MTVYHVQAIGKRLIQSVWRYKSSSNQPRENTSPKKSSSCGDHQTQFSRMFHLTFLSILSTGNPIGRAI